MIGWSSSLASFDDVWPNFLPFAWKHLRAWWAGPIWKPAVRLVLRRAVVVRLHCASRAKLAKFAVWRSRFRTAIEKLLKSLVILALCAACSGTDHFYPQLGEFWASATQDLDSRPRVCYQAFTLLPHVLRSLPPFPTEIIAICVERDSFGLNHTGVLEALSERPIWKTMSSRSCSSPSHGF